MELELENIESFEFDNIKVYYLAGIIKAQTSLDLEVVFKFLSSIYKNKINEEHIEEIEHLIHAGKLGRVKQILEENKCGKCNKLENELIRFKCRHCFHVDCIKVEIIDSIQNQGRYSCRVCKALVTDIEKYHSKIEMAVKDYKKAHYYTNHKNSFPCPKCGEPCEGDTTGHCKCTSCNKMFCGHCQKISKSCSCSFIKKLNT